MSVFDFTPFKNSAFAENIVYTVSGGAGVTIKAVVFHPGLKQFTGEKSTQVQHYPTVVEIDRADIPVVTENADKITCLDTTGTSKTFRVSKIIYSDAGCFKLGLGL